MESVKINRYIDHTLLKADATKEQITALCHEAITHQFFSVCINPYFVPLAKSLLHSSDVKICTVVGFPLGANSMETKKFETCNAIDNGADEIDMVISLGALKSGDWDYVQADIKNVVDSAKIKNKLVKVIFETCLLNNDEKIKACLASQKAGAHFVKTSTGFSNSGATIDDVKLMRSTIPATMQVKASGGVRDLESAMNFIAAGASRLGTSSGVAILKGIESSDKY